jgi:hypothetical protein
MGNAKIQEATVKAEADEAFNEREKLTATLSIMKELMEDASLSIMKEIIEYIAKKMQEKLTTVKAEADEAVGERETLTATLSIMKELMEDIAKYSDMRDRAICEVEELYKSSSI